MHTLYKLQELFETKRESDFALHYLLQLSELIFDSICGDITQVGFLIF